MERQLAGTVEADDLYQTAGHKGQAKQGGKKALGRTPRGRRKKREPGRGHYDKDRPAIIAWISRQGGVVIQATRDFTVTTMQKAANLAVHTGSRLYTDSASSYRALKPTFKGVRSAAAHFAPWPPLATRLGPYLQPRRRSDGSPGGHGLGG